MLFFSTSLLSWREVSKTLLLLNVWQRSRFVQSSNERMDAAGNLCKEKYQMKFNPNVQKDKQKEGSSQGLNRWWNLKNDEKEMEYALKEKIEGKSSERRCKVRAAPPQSGGAQKHPNNYQCIVYWCTEDPNDNQLSVINYWGAKYFNNNVLWLEFFLCVLRLPLLKDFAPSTFSIIWSYPLDLWDHSMIISFWSQSLDILSQASPLSCPLYAFHVSSLQTYPYYLKVRKGLKSKEVVNMRICALLYAPGYWVSP